MIPTRISALQRSVQAYASLAEVFTKAQIEIEDRSHDSCQTYLAAPGGNRAWNLTLSIDIDAIERNDNDPSKKRSDVVTSVCLRSGDRLVYQISYHGRGNYWQIDADIDPEDPESWNTLPYRKALTDATCTETGQVPPNVVSAEILAREYLEIVQAMIDFYRTKSNSVVPRRATSLIPQPSSLPPGSIPAALVPQEKS